MNNNLIFTGKMTDSRHNPQRIAYINCKNTIKKSNNKAELDMICKPEKPFKDFWMNKKIVSCT